MIINWHNEDMRIGFRTLLKAALDQPQPTAALQNAVQELLVLTLHELALDSAPRGR